MAEDRSDQQRSGWRVRPDGSRPALWLIAFPVDDPVLGVFFEDRVFGDGTPPDGVAFFMDTVAVAAHEMEPVRQILAFMDQAIAAGLRHPTDFLHLLRRQDHTVFDDFLAILVVGTLTGPAVEQAAMRPCIGNLAGIFIFQFEQAALAAAEAVMDENRDLLQALA